MRGIVFNGEDAEIRNDVEVRRPGTQRGARPLVAAGVCHSDVSVVDGTIPWPAPSLMGHEGAGIVEAVGSQVTRVKPGDHVVIGTVANCGICDQCNVGKPTWCRSRSATAPRPSPSAVSPPATSRRRRRSRRCTIVKEVQAVPIDPEVPLTSACLIACGVVTGVGSVFNRANVAAGRQRRGVRRRRRRPLDHPGAAHQGRESHHRGRHPGVERAARAAARAPRTSSTRRRSTRSTGDPRAPPVPTPRCPRVRSARGGVNWSFECVGHPAVTAQAVQVLDWGGMCVQVGVPGAGRHLRHPDHAPHPGRPRHHRQPRRRGARAARHPGDRRPVQEGPARPRLDGQQDLPDGELLHVVEDMHEGTLARGVLTF